MAGFTKDGGWNPDDGPVWKSDDPRWLIDPPYRFFRYQLRFGGRCVYCAEPIPAGSVELYSRVIQAVAHRACHADYDQKVPPGGVPTR